MESTNQAEDLDLEEVRKAWELVRVYVLTPRMKSI